MSRCREEFAEFVQALRDIARELRDSPQPAPVEYRRCPECSQVRPIGRLHRTIKLTRSDYLPTPPEYHCTTCDAFSVRLVDDVDPDNPATTSVKAICAAPEPRPIVNRWQRCRYPAPKEAYPQLQCPRCGTTGQRPGPRLPTRSLTLTRAGDFGHLCTRLRTSTQRLLCP